MSVLKMYLLTGAKRRVAGCWDDEIDSSPVDHSRKFLIFSELSGLRVPSIIELDDGKD